MVSRILLLFLLIYCSSVIAQLNPPAGYYGSAEGKTGRELRESLHAIVDEHIALPYTSSDLDVWDALEVLDEDPSNPEYILTLYSAQSLPKADKDGSSDAATVWNREHTWPQSYGFSGEEDWPAYADLHALRATNKSLNSSRGNEYFDNGGSEVTFGSGVPTGNRSDADSWEVRDAMKGDVARGLFYMAVRYEGDAIGEPDLFLSDVPPNEGESRMGLLSVLLEWNAADPVDDAERNRNHAIYEQFQGNRNPFIDHPEWVSEIWPLDESGEPNEEGSDSRLIISEYVEGSSYNKAVELFNAGATSIDLSVFSVALYSNGATGSPSQSLQLAGSLGARETIVIANGKADALLLERADVTDDATINFNGNDAVAILKGVEPVDVLGVRGSADEFAKDVTLIRGSTIRRGAATYAASEWSAQGIDAFGDLGQHVFTPFVRKLDVSVLDLKEGEAVLRATVEEGVDYLIERSGSLDSWEPAGAGGNGSGSPVIHQVELSFPVFYRLTEK